MKRISNTDKSSAHFTEMRAFESFVVQIIIQKINQLKIKISFSFDLPYQKPNCVWVNNLLLHKEEQMISNYFF